MFIATANTLDTIPRPLLDRMEVIRLSGYIEQEKIAIARTYLIPKSLKKTGLKKGQVKYPKAALSAIANGYAREAGVRNFEKALDRIHRKLAMRMVLGEVKTPFTVNADEIEDLLGQPMFREDVEKTLDRPGMALGLAWTNFGGDVLIIEAVNNPGTPGIKLTGQMGDVMQESATIAYTYIRHVADENGVSPDFFKKNQIHIHIPAGATPKDGPSAGITMAATLLSLAKNKRIKKGFAMTGELSLVGQVLPIGGLKEKTIAARRNKVRNIIIPAQNERDLEEIPDHVKKGITFHPVQSMKQVIELLLG
jgi:ATP-dependent Lon protease